MRGSAVMSLWRCIVGCPVELHLRSADRPAVRGNKQTVPRHEREDDEVLVHASRHFFPRRMYRVVRILSVPITPGSMTTIGNASFSPSALMSSSPQTVPPNDRSHRGALVVTVLSAYDLISQQQPVAVSLQVAGTTVKTGPPSARHRDRNSYRFVANQVLRVESPLPQLYKSKALLTVEYDDPRENLSCELVCKSVHIHETTWLILNLDKITSTNNNSSLVSDEEVIPTLRLQVRLEGPYRTEIAAFVSFGKFWFQCMDNAEAATRQVVKKLPSLPLRYLLVPTVPLVTAVVVSSPILVGVLVVGLPVFLPILVVVGGVLLASSLVVGILAASTTNGRTQIGSVLAPMYHTLLSTPSGQTLVYETGPRPTPVSVARSILPTDLMGKLIVSLVIDALGSASYLLPVVGEGMDVMWAPLQTILIMAMYDSVSPNLKYISFIEEILPLTDVVPSATIGWLTEFGPQLVPALNKPRESMTNGSGMSIVTAGTTSVGTPTL